MTKFWEAFNGLMVTRGDLDIEILVEEVILAQKMMIEKYNKARKVVIITTQMLDSMIKNSRLTRAEASSVANSILNDTDAVMLSGGSAKGKYSLEAVIIMAIICQRTDRMLPSCIVTISTTAASCALPKPFAAVQWKSRKIGIAFDRGATEDEKSAKSVRKYFPKAEILALTINPLTSCQVVEEIVSTNDFTASVKPWP